MRDFKDPEGRVWTATAVEDEGPDYKGRLHMVFRPADGGDELELHDVRWNSARTARRTIETMSLVELHRRLRSAVGRQSAPAPS